MTIRKLNVYAFVLLGSILFTSCGGGSEKKSEASEASSDFEEAKSQVISDIDQVIMDLPPPSEVPYLLMATGSEYDAEIVNGLEKLDSYTSPTSKAALNLGIYTTDVGYLSSYEKAQEALDYVGACQKLAESIGIASAMDLELIGRFERNLNNKDSLKILVDQVVERSSERLSALDRMYVAGLILGGTYIEGLYISTRLIQNYPEDLPAETSTLILEPLIKIVIDQGKSLEDMIKVMNDLEENEAIATLKTDLESIKTIYDGELAEVSEKISNNTGDYVLQRTVLNSLTSEVSRIRGSMVD